MNVKLQNQEVGRPARAERRACVASWRIGTPGESLTREQRKFEAWKEELSCQEERLLERIASAVNLEGACQKVKANKGAAGVDGMSAALLPKWLETNLTRLQGELLKGSYRPQAVKGVDIPKPNGGVRKLGIPTVIDRMVQQAFVQVLTPELDPQMSPSSYGFRPGKNAHDAIKKASQYVRRGYVYAVDLDLEKFFDKVNHDKLMSRLAQRIKDKRVLYYIRQMLESGIMDYDGICQKREQGTPQGGPISPLLANVMLDDLDKELERRGHQFCRYADDCIIFVKSKEAAQRVLEGVSNFVEKQLKLKVNREKSKAAYVEDCVYLGYIIGKGGELETAPCKRGTTEGWDKSGNKPQ